MNYKGSVYAEYMPVHLLHLAINAYIFTAVHMYFANVKTYSRIYNLSYNCACYPQMTKLMGQC